MKSRRILLVLALGVFFGACTMSGGSTTTRSSSDTPAPVEARWPAPADPMVRAVAAGLVPETHETLEHHVHAHLDVFIDGAPQIVPAGIGIKIDDPAVHSGPGPSYGGISVPCEQPCISPLHTHDTSGVLHTESATDVDNTLGQFFIEWGVRLDGQCVGEYCSPSSPIAVYVDGQPVATDAASLNGIALLDRREIAVVIGTPPDVIPDAFPSI